MKKYFLDTNIIIDLLSQRLLDDSEILKLLEDIPYSNLYVSALSVHITFYVLRIKSNSNLFNQARFFFDLVNVIPLTEEITKKAMSIEFKDFEDALQYFSAVKNCDYILTRDKKDFEKIQRLAPSPVKILNKYHL